MDYDDVSDRPADTSSSLTAPPPVDYPNVRQSGQKPRAMRREASGDVDCHFVLSRIFGHQGYKGKQKEIFQAAVRGADVFVLAPTGMGKSVCFQHGITIVISPLLSLMKNQVANLHKKYRYAAALTSETPPDERLAIIKDISSGHPRNRLLYITPERLSSADFSKLLQKVYQNGELNRFVVDEVKPIEWGHDFRAEYRKLGSLRDRFPDVPIMALTASATPHVVEDIISNLKMSRDHLYKVVHPFNRANLYYEVRYLSNADPALHMHDVYEYISTLHRRRKRASSGIVYCRTRAICDQLSQYLRAKGLSARPYHRGVKPQLLDKTLREWEMGGSGEGGVDVVCATIAFGMGIDKPDVVSQELPPFIQLHPTPHRAEQRLITAQATIKKQACKLHPRLNMGANAVWQDGQAPAKCVLFYSREDALRIRKLTGDANNRRMAANGPPPSQRAMNSLRALEAFAESVNICRHVSLCRYFGEVIDDKDPEVLRRYCNAMCDVCKYPDKVRDRKSNLSSDEWVSSQAATIQRTNANFDDDDDVDGYPRPRPRPVAQTVTSSESRLQQYPAAGLQNNRIMQPPSAPWRGPSHLPKENRPSTSGTSSKRGFSPGPPVAPTKRPRNEYDPLSSKVKQFASLGTVKKPFKPPLMISKPTVRSVDIDLSEDIALEHPSKGEDRNVAKRPRKRSISPVPTPREKGDPVLLDDAAPMRSSSPVDGLEDVMINLDVGFSQKISPSVRHGACARMSKALRKILRKHGDKYHEAWSSLDHDARAELITSTTKKTEFSIFSMCTTEEGYRSRTETMLDAIKTLSSPEAWTDSSADDDYEDAREIVQFIRDASRLTR
ncbi:ATP-dependent DNA helicase [Punctularia strigosozonata HHB-11173 SS5]|uniref:ATP-dependent DNA helicase n=1 Tax=Punctularia strigosozonata (strain HHB-11173) TaxID=741275 RepID=UPI0004417522|nr:ATP-dependent DNA helicase [Punctularia strigosozonata HHB-11173 SS5]EIN12531.1 ATP-dependent DNA helicase [Punctularia strigosozonata HHB-11173 SS5]